MPNINKALFITPSNIGDVILTLPALDCLRANFPQAKITLMTSPQGKELFVDNPYLDKLIIYDKYSPLRKKIALFFMLSREGLDLVLDFRNSLYGALLPAKFRTSPFLRIPRNIRHMQERNLYRLRQALKVAPSGAGIAANKSLFISETDKDYIRGLLEKNNISSEDKIIVLAPVARGANRRWEKEKFALLAQELSKEYKVILVGRDSDKSTTQYVRGEGKNIFDFSGLTNLKQLASLLKYAALVICPDTGVLQIASYMDAPVLALVGAGDELKYGPWTKNKKGIISRELFCRPCIEAQCRFGTVECLRFIKVEDVLIRAREILENREERREKGEERDNFKRILIVRTDRIGDVLLSTPVIKALRENYPNSYIAMMVSPHTKDIVEGNPYLDEAIIYDKDAKHKKWYRAIKFALNLKKKRFDLALILHPTNRVHLVTFLAGIPKRVGYDRKLGFLLTDRIKHTKELGEKHELEYNLDLLKYLNIEVKDKNLYMPIRQESEKWVEEFLAQEGLEETDKILAIHPGASCISKVWPLERFATVADKLIEGYGFKVLIIGGPKDMAKSETVAKDMQHSAVNLAGKTSVSQLASVLRRCQLFISNDSGPVHIASSLGISVISIFGRSQKGLSPARWGPTSGNSRVAHKTVGCVECLAHNCVKHFACLEAVSVDYVLNIADSLLRDTHEINRKGVSNRGVSLK